jgi:hypothetical protein
MRKRLDSGGHFARRAALASGILVLIAAAAAVALAERSGAAGRGSTGRVDIEPVAQVSLVPLAPTNPFKTAAMRHFVATRSGNITAAVYDVASGTTFLYRPGHREQTASIVKVNILALLLAQAQANHEPLDGDDQATAEGMIEESDNDDATDLWAEEGGAPAVAAFDARLGMTHTTPNWAWGLTETTPRDQLILLRHIALPNKVLHYDYRETELHLMEPVISFDYWGITAGPPPSAIVAVKNGWLPVSNGWQINSIGMVRGRHRFYLIAVMTNGNPSEGYGIDTIEGLSNIVWANLRDRLGPGSPTTGASGASGATGSSGTTGASGASGPAG